MFPGNILRKILIDQQRRFQNYPTGVPRRVNPERYLYSQRIVVVSGVRRCGKSTLLRQIAENFSEYIYLNLDDERLVGLTLNDLSEVLQILEELYPGFRTLFADEIQNISGWEHFIRRIHDDGYRIFLTGSNAHMLSSELGTHLTGRYIRIELWPFGFDELCNAAGIATGPAGSVEEATFLRECTRFLEYGGFPEMIGGQDPELLQRTYEDIVFRDVVSRYNIRETLAFRELARYIFTNMTHEASYHNLAGAVGIRSAMTVRSWIGYLEETYLIGGCFQYNYSLKQQHARNRKYYGIDSGMRNAVSFRFSEDTGMLLENQVYIELRRRGFEIFWHRGTHECDFLIRDRGKIIQVIQVCAELSEYNRIREMKGIVEAIDMCRCPGLIITLHQDEEVATGEHSIRIISFWRWALGESGWKQ